MLGKIRTEEVLSIEQIPFDQIENNLGIPKEVFLRHPQYNDIIYALSHLVCGRSMLTPLIESSEYTNNKFKFSAARYSLKKNENQRLLMIVHPISDQIRFENEYNFDNKEIDLLYKGEILSKEIDLSHDGELIDCLIQLIPGSNCTVAVPKFSLDIPENLGQVEQPPENIEKLKNGGEIIIAQQDQVFNVKLCLYSPNMITVSENFDRLMQQNNKHGVQVSNPDIPSIFNENHETLQNITKDKEQTQTGIKR